MIVHLTKTTNLVVEISEADIYDMARVHHMTPRQDGQDIGEWLFDTLTDDALAELVGKSDVEDEDIEVDEIEDDEDDEDE